MQNSLTRLILMISFSVLTISACATFPSENHDPAKNNKETYNKDLKECKEDYQEIPSGIHIRQWIGCMKLKGWN